MTSKEIKIQVDENEEEAFEKGPFFDLLWTSQDLALTLLKSDGRSLSHNVMK